MNLIGLTVAHPSKCLRSRHCSVFYYAHFYILDRRPVWGTFRFKPPKKPHHFINSFVVWPTPRKHTPNVIFATHTHYTHRCVRLLPGYYVPPYILFLFIFILFDFDFICVHTCNAFGSYNGLHIDTHIVYNALFVACTARRKTVCAYVLVYMCVKVVKEEKRIQQSKRKKIQKKLYAFTYKRM